MKPACGLAVIVTFLETTALTQPWLLVTVNVTTNVPVVANVCVGFCSDDVLAAPLPGSPKFHDQLFTVPTLATDISVKEISLVAQLGAAKLKLAVGNGCTVTGTMVAADTQLATVTVTL